MIHFKCFNSLDDINEWREEEGKDVKIINIDYSEPAHHFYVVWFEYNEKEEYTKKTVHPISRDGSRSDMSVPVNILLKNGCKCKGRYDYDKCMWVVENICRIVGCTANFKIIKMGKNKPRTAVNRRVNKLLAECPNECEWWDGGYPECMLPWSHKGCNGNPFVCRKFYYKYLASAAKPLQDIINEFDKRQMNNKDN